MLRWNDLDNYVSNTYQYTKTVRMTSIQAFTKCEITATDQEKQKQFNELLLPSYQH